MDLFLNMYLCISFTYTICVCIYIYTHTHYIYVYICTCLFYSVQRELDRDMFASDPRSESRLRHL